MINLTSLKKLTAYVNQTIDSMSHMTMTGMQLHSNATFHPQISSDLEEQITVKELLNLKPFIYVDCDLELICSDGKVFLDQKRSRRLIHHIIFHLIPAFYKNNPGEKLPLQFRFAGHDLIYVDSPNIVLNLHYLRNKAESAV